MSIPVTIFSGTAPDTAPLRQCDRCSTEQSQRDGCQMSPARWYCGACYRGLVLGRLSASRAKKSR